MNKQEISKSDLILLLLYSKGYSGKINEPVKGVTRLMKLLFLIKEEGRINDLFNFEAYKMGPFSSEVYPELEFLKNFPSPEQSFLQTSIEKSNGNTNDPEQVKIIDDITSFEGTPLNNSEINTEFSLSDLGKKIAEQLWDSLDNLQKESIEKIKIKYASLTLKDLLRYVYKNYPEMAINSEIKNQL